MNNKNQSIYIIDALRTPIGKLHGALSHIRPDDLMATLVKQCIKRKKLPLSSVDGIILGCANQAGEDNRNIARMVAFLAHLPYESTAITVNSLCASGMDAIFSGIRRIALNEGDLYLVGGIESMSRSPMVTSKVDQSVEDSMIGWRFINPNIHQSCPPLSMPETAELLADYYKIDRTTQDEYAFQSRQKYQAALEANFWQKEIVPIQDTQNQLYGSDEQHRVLSLDLLSKLPKLVTNGHCISSGNAARIGDGAALIALASERYIKTHNITPIARVKSWANASTHPNMMSLSAVAAAKKAVQNSDLQMDDLGTIEMSEAFAVQALVCIKELELDPKKVNPNGGALSIGNPIAVGATRLAVSLVNQLNQATSKQFGMATTCAGLGTGAALILEKS